MGQPVSIVSLEPHTFLIWKCNSALLKATTEVASCSQSLNYQPNHAECLQRRERREGEERRGEEGVEGEEGGERRGGRGEEGVEEGATKPCPVPAVERTGGRGGEAEAQCLGWCTLNSLAPQAPPKRPGKA